MSETPTLLEDLLEKRSIMAAEAEAILDTAKAEARDLSTEDEARASDLHSEMKALTAEIELRESIERSRFAAAKANASVSIKSEPLTYTPEARTSYFKDLATVHGGIAGDTLGARERLERHGKEMSVEMDKRSARRSDDGEREVRSFAGEGSLFEKRANSRTDGAGGYFVPPTWLIDQFAAALRYGRPVVNSLRQVALPTGTDSISIPTITTGTLTGVQSADNAALSNQDIVDSYVTAPVKTIGGYVDASIQLLEQSPNEIIDQVILQDLVADYLYQTDVQALNGSGSSGQITGLLNVSGINSVTYTDASPTAVAHWAPLAKAISKTVQARKLGDGISCFMHPRRYYFLAGGLDSSNRPLIVPNNNAYNPMATTGSEAYAGAVANLVLGTPVYLDGAIATNTGAGTNQDTILFNRGDDTLFMEGELRTDVFREVLSSTAGIRFRAYNYVAMLPRYAQSITTITGTGLVAPSGY